RLASELAGLASEAPLSAFTAMGLSAGGSSAATGCGTTFIVASSGCEKLTGVMISPGVTKTRAPILVQFHIFTANDIGMRMQPCDAGYPGSTPACMATPDQVIRCIKGIGAPL